MTPVEQFAHAILTALRAGLTPDQIKTAIHTAMEVKP